MISEEPRQITPAPPGLQVMCITTEPPHWYRVPVIALAVVEEVLHDDRHGRVTEDDRSSIMDAVVWDSEIGPALAAQSVTVWYYTTEAAADPDPAEALAEYESRYPAELRAQFARDRAEQ